MKKYLGCGSRKTPEDILKKMTEIAERLAAYGWLLRSGAADGADLAFEAGCDKAAGPKEIFLPWKGFNKSSSNLYSISQDALTLASTIHHVWNKLSPGAKKLHARNCYQVLGEKLDDPVELLICWTPGGKEAGGTATALKIAKIHKVRIINLATEDLDLVQFS